MSLRIFAFILSLAIVFLQCQYSAEEEEAWKRVGFWKPGTPDSEIESTLFTHLVFCFLHINRSSFEISHESEQQHLASFSRTVKQKNPSVKTIVSIWGEKSYRLMMRNASSRQIFIQSSLNVATTYGFDGIDFFWNTDYPTGTIKSDMKNMATFLQEWRTWTTYMKLILTATVPPSPNLTSSIMYPIKTIEANLDWLHVTTFGYTLPYNSPNFTAASSPLYDPSNNKLNTDYFIHQWIDSGFPASKLVMGLSLYGYSWNLADPKDHGIGAPADGKGASSPRGMIVYKEIKAAIQFNGGDSYYNATYVENYCSYGPTWVAFDGVEAVREKVSYARNNKLLGYFLWPVSDDDNWELSLAAIGENMTKGDDISGKKDELKIILTTAWLRLFCYLAP